MPSVVQYSSTGNAYSNAVVTGTKWSASSLTFSFPNETAAYGSQYGNGELSKNFTGLNAAQQTLERSVLASYANVAKLTFTELKGDGAGSADLRFASSTAPGTSWAYTPGASNEAGDVWIGQRGAYSNPVRGSYAWLIFNHETGHALGFKETNETVGAFGSMPSDHDSLENSVMSYSSYVGASAAKGFLNGAFDYPQSLMLDDIRAIQALYGANFGSAGANVVYSWNPKTGETSINGVAQGAPGANRVFMTIWDAGAHSTYDLSAYESDLSIDLRPGAWSIFSPDQLAHLDGLGADTHRAAGNVANAYNVSDGGNNGLIDDVIGGKGADRMTGNDADNAFTGGGGNDIIDGGLGRNTAIFSGKAADYTLTAGPDGSWTVVDSQAGRDGSDLLRNIQQVKFLDGTKDLATVAPAASAVIPTTSLPAANASAPNTPAASTAEAPAMAPTGKAAPANEALAAQGAPAPATTASSDAAIAPVTAATRAAGPEAAAYWNVLHTHAPEGTPAGPFDALVNSIVKAAAATTSVLTTVYNFFTGTTPTEAVLSHMLEGGNADSTAFTGAAVMDRYINVALDLGTHGDSEASFGEAYGSLSMQDSLQKASLTIYGQAIPDAQTDAMLELWMGATTRSQSSQLVNGSDLSGKAAMVGWLLANSVLSDVGVYAEANDAYLRQLAVDPHYKVDLLGYADTHAAALAA